MKRYILTLLSTLALLHGAAYPSVPEKKTVPVPPELVGYGQYYVSNGHGRWDSAMPQLISRDEYYKQGMEFLNNTATYQTKAILSDPETKGLVTNQSIPNYAQALKLLYKSAITYNNPISAYVVITLSMRIYGKSQNNPYWQDFPTLSKLLYEYSVCESYSLYGESLERTKQYSMAYKVYKQGYERMECDSWIRAVLGGRLSMIGKIANFANNQ